MTHAIRHARAPHPARWRRRASVVARTAQTVLTVLLMAALSVFAGIGVVATVAVWALT